VTQPGTEKTSKSATKTTKVLCPNPEAEKRRDRREKEEPGGEEGKY